MQREKKCDSRPGNMCSFSNQIWFHLKLFIPDSAYKINSFYAFESSKLVHFIIFYTHHPLPMGTTAVHKTMMAVPLVCNSCQPISLSWLFIASFVSCLCVSAGPLPIPLPCQCTHRDCSESHFAKRTPKSDLQSHTCPHA